MVIAPQFELPFEVEERPKPFEAEYPIAAFILSTALKTKKIKWKFDGRGGCIDEGVIPIPAKVRPVILSGGII